MKIRRSNGWINATAKKWNGYSWVNADVKRWNGSSWGNLSSSTKVATINSTWSQAYNQSNVQVRIQGSNKLIQGKADNDTVNNICRSLVGFNTSSVRGKNISKIRIYLRANWWYYITGGTVHLGWHGHSSKPTRFSHNIYNGATGLFTARAQAIWIDMPQEFVSGVKNGTVTGFSIYYNANAWHGYGLFDGHGMTYAPKMEVTYSE